MAVPYRLALVLSGGNALGAYQAGSYQAMLERGYEPDRVSGASAGAINGALICGNPPEKRIAALKKLWRPAAMGSGSDKHWEFAEHLRRTLAATAFMATGPRHLFTPRNLYGPWWNPFGNTEPASLYDSSPMHGTLEALIDFDLLNAATPRFCATAVDLNTGEDVVFDTAKRRLDVNHLRASAALLPAFPPVEIDGRMLADGGISANLPLDTVLADPPDQPLLCIAIDLLPLRGPRPKTLGDAACRMQDLIFATQSRRAIAAWQALFDQQARQGETSAITLLHLTYSDQRQEVSGKAFDFSPQSVATRWEAGYRDMSDALACLRAGNVEIGEAGLTVYAQRKRDGGARILERIRLDLCPGDG